MKQAQISNIKKALEKQKKDVTKSKTAAENMLKSLGILTPKGNFTKAFKATK
jgi:hypothetical protein